MIDVKCLVYEEFMLCLRGEGVERTQTCCFEKSRRRTKNETGKVREMRPVRPSFDTDRQPEVL